MWDIDPKKKTNLQYFQKIVTVLSAPCFPWASVGMGSYLFRSLGAATKF